ncbi:MAG: hypothetical protein JRN35_08615 [Nitrososphaerota archaeon]|nr:hypothetical protein [Nitrososphaerota archaeon]
MQEAPPDDVGFKSVGIVAAAQLEVHCCTAVSITKVVVAGEVTGVQDGEPVVEQVAAVGIDHVRVAVSVGSLPLHANWTSSTLYW